MLTNEHGHFLLTLAAFLALSQALVGLIGAQRGWRNWMRMVPALAHVQFLAVLFSFFLLVRAFVVSDFSLAIVAENSALSKPMLYKVAGTWGNHEGSMLMWVTILALYGAMVAFASNKIPAVLRARVLGIQGLIGFAFYAFILLTSNPFWRLASPPLDGLGLNPILQDPGLAFHPPALYLGYVGLSVAFSFAIAGLLDGRIDAAWARFVRPWTLAAWIFLTIGIALGSWWAYYELGWGGFWFWDPVENASLMPWLISVALLHSAIVVEKRDSLKSWTILLAILSFAFSLIGTFIVRSGVITSVHSFAADPARGTFILVIILSTLIIGLSLYAWRAPKLIPSGTFAPISRESGIVINNLLLCVGMAIVFIGTLWPLLVEVVSGKILSVGEPFFNSSFIPFMLLLALLLPIGASIPWKRAGYKHLRPLLISVGLVSAGLALATLLRQKGLSLMAPLTILFASWVILGTLFELHQRARHGQNYLTRLFSIPSAEWGKALAHIGFGLIILGVGIVRASQFESISSEAPATEFDAGPYKLYFREIEEGLGPNYEFLRGIFDVTIKDRSFHLEPEIRTFPLEGMPTTEAAIARDGLGDIYLVMRQGNETGKVSIYFYHKPLVNLLWLGAMTMVMGGLLSLKDRRMRLGVRA